MGDHPLSEQKKDPTGWSSSVSGEGVDQAIRSLGYRSQSPKYRMVDAIRTFCREAGGPEVVTAVPADRLIRRLWEVEGDRSALASRRRNLSSLRSAVNADLTARYHSGDNPDGIIIGPQYNFVICDEAKDQALQALRDMAPENGGGRDLQRIEELLRQAGGLLGDLEEGDPAVPGGRADALEALREAVQGLAARLGVATFPGEAADGTEPPSEPEHAGGPPAEEDVEEAYEDVEVVEEAGGEAEEPPAEGPDEEGVAGDPPAEEDVEEAYEDVEVVEEADGEAEEPATEGPDEEGGAEDLLAEEDLEEAYEDVELVEEADGDADTGDGAGEAEGEEGGDGVLEWAGLDPEALEAERDPERSRLLAEEFNRSLAAMDRFYNQYILVPEGTYPVRGSASDGEEELPTELAVFYIGKFPVTNSLFELFVERTGYRTTAERLGWGTVYRGRYRRETDERSGSRTLHVGRGVVCSRVEGACWYQPAGPGSGLRGKRNHPVVQVSLEDALAFAAWTGKRLPAGEEWEAAMRTSDGNLLPWGDAWVPEACNAEEACIGDTSPVDMFTAFENPLGVADGLGNVMEWTSSAARGDAGGRRVARGGGWIARRGVTLADGEDLCPSARSNILGFRCVAC